MLMFYYYCNIARHALVLFIVVFTVMSSCHIHAMVRVNCKVNLLLFVIKCETSQVM